MSQVDGTTSTGRPSLRVLLVEDHPDLAEVTAEFLEAEGLEVRTALSGRTALEIAAVFRPQLLLCDMNLPDMTGVEVVRELRSNPATKGTYMVMLTAMSETQMAQRGGNVGDGRIDAFLSKPITLEAIGTLVSRVLARSRSTAPQD